MKYRVFNTEAEAANLSNRVNDFAVSLDGGIVGTDNSGSAPTINRVNLGTASSSAQFFGHIRSLRYYNTRKPNEFLQEVTS